ncbi:hypothetical protein VI08_15440 [Luteibacter yeojuensis]|uniref:Uncharacterized protein n=1 Tax=Luteibacter yeojuensis TaxID=345309 RepID=A0A0F3KFU9_9GAMM|nr:hypothetical protein VI08_15440 [Luteibacter yeojuensis]
MKLFVVGTITSSTTERIINPLNARRCVTTIKFAAPKSTIVNSSRDPTRSHTSEWIKNKITFVGESEHQSLDEPNGELARVISLLNVIIFHIGNVPHILRVLSERISGVLACVGPLEVLLSGIFCRHADSIEIKRVRFIPRIALGVPHDDFVATGESTTRVQPVSKLPHYSIAQPKTEPPEDRRKFDIQGKDFIVLDEISDLPAKAAAVSKSRNNFFDNALLPFEIGGQIRLLLVGLADIVGRRSDDQIE